FQGKSPASVLGAILKDPAPRLSDRQPPVSRTLDHVVATCLAKDPDERWQSAADLERELKWIAAAPMDAGEQARVAPAKRRAWADRAFVGVIGLAAGAALVSTLVLRRPPAPAGVMHVQIGVAPA